MSVRIHSELLARIHAHAAEGYPHEVVGLLAGDPVTGLVQAVHPLINERADSPRNRYRVSGLGVHKAERALEDRGLVLLGTYHSHPDHTAQYSAYDRDHALPNLTYLIIAVARGHVRDTRGWRLVEDRSSMVPVPLTLTQGT